MLRAAFDTNIIVRLMLAKPNSIAGKVGRALADGQFELVLSLPVIDEIRHTLSSPHLRVKHDRTSAEVDAFVERLIRLARVTPGTASPSVPELAVRDADDIKVLGAAVEGNASLLVTQDYDLLALGGYEGIRVVELSEFFRILQALENDRMADK